MPLFASLNKANLDDDLPDEHLPNVLLPPPPFKETVISGDEKQSHGNQTTSNPTNSDSSDSFSFAELPSNKRPLKN